MAGCQKEDKEVLHESESASSLPTQGTMIKLGRQMNNPYSVANMQKALDEIKGEGLLKSSPQEGGVIQTTHLYVRFLPKDLQEYSELFETFELLLYDYPLDYVIEEDGEYYHDPDIPADQITWQYTTVPITFQFPDIEFEILEECFIPEEKEGLKSGGMSIWALVEERALLNAGYFDLAHEGESSDIETKNLSLQRPQGRIRVWDTTHGRFEPARGVTVRCQLGVKIGRGTTDENGNYSVDARFRAGPHYRLFFYNPGRHFIRNCLINFRESKSYGLGYHNKRGHNRDINASSRAYPYCIVSNAAFDYYAWCEANNILAPHPNLIIWVTPLFDSSAPMLSRVWHPIGFNSNSGWSNFFLNLFLGPATNALNYSTKIINAQPDITIEKSSSNTSLNYYRTTVHELAHASHMRQVGSLYWSLYINYIITYGPYGDASKKNSGICGVGEMWGFYIGGLLASEYYGGDWFNGTRYWFHPQILRQLGANADTEEDATLTNPLIENQIFACLTSDVRSHEQLRNRLVQNYGRQQEITTVFEAYGF